MPELRVWVTIAGTNHYHRVGSFGHGVKTIRYFADKYEIDDFGLETGDDGWWSEWEDDYGLNIHAQDLSMYA